MSPLVLVVDDERKIRDLVRSYLERAGIDVLTTASGAEAIVMARRSRPDLVVLDLGLPDVPGDEVAREIREAGDLPILMLPARATEADRVHGLELGADDYVTKPFSPRELVARVKALQRRPRIAATNTSTTQFGELAIDAERREVLVGDQPVELSALEFDLLATLTGAPGRVFSRRQLIDRVWGSDFYGDERVVDVHIRNLRRALGDDADAPRWVGTVRGVGYKSLVAPS